jgi:phosphate transport system substrate-binding protein
MKITARTIALAATASLAACAYWQDAPDAKHPASGESSTPPTATVDSTAPQGDGTRIRLRGSNTVGGAPAMLAPKLALAFLQRQGSSDAAIHDEKKDENHITVTGTVEGKAVTFEVDSPGSKVAFECLGDGSCDVGMASRPVQLDEVNKLSSLGDLTSLAAEHVIGLDGIAVIVNRGNGVNKLTIAQIDALFEGKITNWSQVGGTPGDVHPYIRDKKSGTYDTFVQFVTHGRDLPTGRAKVDDSDGIAAGVAHDEGGIGFVGLPYVGDTKAVAVQDGDATPLAPTPFTIATEDYPFSRRLYLYTPPNRVAPMAAKFVDFALSDDGQKVVAQTGFVGLNVTTADVSPPANAPAGYSKGVGGARRLSFNLRFKTNTTALDGKASQDLERLVRYIRATTNLSHSLELFGFADNQGDEGHNVDLSKQRAKGVSEELAKRGVVAQVVDGFGSALPIAPNDSPEGRNKNRRVEVWLR